MPPKKRLSQQKDQELNGFIDEMIGEGIADNEIQSFVNDFVAKYGEDVPTTTAPKTAPEVKKKEVQPSNPKMQPIENTDVFFGGLVTPIQNLKTAQKNGNSKPTQEQKIVQEQKVNKREPKPSYLQKVFSPIKKAYEEATNIPQENKREIVKKTAQKLLGFTPTDEQIDNELKANPHKFDDALVVDYKNNNDIDEFTSMPFESTSKVDEIREKVEQGLPLSQTELELVKGGLSKAYQGFSEVPNDEIQSGLIALMKSEREKVKNNIITAYNRNELEGRINSGNVRPEDIENIFSIAHKGTLNEQIDYNDIATKYNEKQKEIMRNVDESIDKGVQTLIEFDEQLKIQKSHAKDNLDIAKAQNDIFNNQQTKEDVKYAQSQLDLISDLERKRNKYLDGQIEQATNAAVKEMLYQFSPYLETDKNGFLNEVGTYNLPRLVEDYVSRQSKGKQALLTYKNNGQIKGNVYLENALRQEVDFSAKNHEILKKVEGGITSSMPESAKPLIGQVLGLQRGKDGEIIPENAVHKMNAVNTAKTFQLQIEVDKQNISLENALRSPEVRALIGDELDDLNEQYSQHKISATDFKNARLKLLLQTPQTKNIADSYISAVINASKQNEREVRNYVNTLAPDFAKYTKFNSKGEVESIAGLSPQEFANAMSQVDRGRNKAREFAFEDFVYRSSERGNEEMNKAILESGGTVEAVASMAFKNTLFNMTQSRAKWLYDKTGIDFFNEARKGMMYGANKSEEYLASDFAQSYTDYEAGDWGALTNPYFWVHSVSSSAPYMVESMATGYLGGMGIGSALLKMGMSEGVGTAIALSRSGRIAQKVVGGILGGTEEAFSNMQMNYTDLINEGYSVQEASRISKSAFAMEVIPNVVLSGISLETLFRATSKPTFKNVVKKGLTTILEQGTTEPIGEVNQGFVVEKAKGSDIGFWDYGMNTKDGFNNLIGGFAGSLGSGGGMTAFHLVADAARWNKIYNISTNEMQDAVRQSGVADMVRNVSPTRRKLNLDILAQNSLDYEHQYQNTPAGQEKEELRKKAREALAIYNYAKEYASQIEGKDVNDINADYLAHTRALSKQYQVLADNASSSNKNNYQRQADYYAGIAEQVERGKPSEIYAFQTPNGRVFISENTARVLADGSLRKSNDSFNESVRDGAITGIDVSNNEEVRKKLEDKFNVALKSKPAPISPTISQEQGDLITQNIEEENKAKQQAQQLQLDNSSPILVVEENGKFTVNNPSGVKETFDTREEADKRVVEINEQLSNAPNELEVVEKNGKFEVENAGKIETFDTRQEAENRINEIKNKTPQNETTINAETANTESTATIGQENLSKTQDEVDSDIDKTKGGITTEIDSQEITEGNPRKGTFEGIEIEVSKTDNGYTYSTPEFDVEVSEDEHNENLKNKSLILNAVVSSSDDTNRNTTTSTPTAETATNQEVDNSQNVDELIGKEVLFNGERGVIKQDEGGKITFENDKVIRELTSDDKAIEFVEDKQERPEISVLGNEVKVGNDVYEFVSTNLDKNGNVVSVTLINDKGQKITNRNADLALDIAIAKNNDEFNRRTEGQTTEQTTEQTAEIVSNELNNSNLNVLNELVNEMPTVVGNAIDELRNTDKDKEPKKVNELIEKINKWIDKTKENVRNSNAPKAEKSNAIIALDNLKNNLNTKAKQEVEKTLQNINRKINKQNEKLEKQGVDKTPTTTKAKTAPSTNENTVENETEQTEQSSDKQTADRISKETKEELPNLDDDFLENIPKVVDDTLTAMRNDIEALAPEEMQVMVLETVEWIDDSIKSARNSKMTDKEKNKVVNSLNKIKTNLNKYYEKLEKQRVAKTTNVTTTETIRGNESTPQQHETTNAPTTATEGTFIGADGNLRNEPNGIEQIEQAERELSRNEEEIRKNEERIRAERQRIEGHTDRLKVSEIEVRPDIFQFKKQDNDSGTNAKERLEGDFDSNLAGTVSVWVDEKGELGEKGKVYVVDGHHRMELAKRKSEEFINVFYIKADTAKEARLVGAMANIAQGRGTAIDAAKVFREGGNIKALSSFNPKSVVGQQGKRLARLNDDVFTSLTVGTIPLKTALAISEIPKDFQSKLAPIIIKVANNPAISESGLALFAKTRAEDIKNGLLKSEMIQTLFGDEEVIANYAQQAELESRILNGIKDDAKLLKNASRNADVLESANSQIDVEMTESESKKLKIALGLYQRYRQRKSVQNILKLATEEFEKAKGNKAKERIADKAILDIKKTLEEEYNKEFPSTAKTEQKENEKTAQKTEQKADKKEGKTQTETNKKQEQKADKKTEQKATEKTDKLYHRGEVNQGGNVSEVLERNGIEQDKQHHVGDFNEFVKSNGSVLVKGIWRIINKTADLLGVNVKIISDEDYYSEYPKGTNGAFKNGNIVIRSGIFADPKRAAYILTHEVTHGTTSHIIDAVKNGNKEVLSKLTDKQIKAAQDLSKLFDRIKNRKDLKGQYGIEDEHEFLSELSNPEFAGKLKGKDKGIIERILDLVMGVLGIQKNDYDKARTILRDLMTKPDNVGTYSQDSDDIRYHRDSSGNVVIEGKNKERLDKLVEEIKGIDDKKQREDKLEEVKKGIENNPLLRGKNQADYRSKFIDYVSEKIEDFEAQKEQERLDKEAKDKAEQEAKEKAEQEAKEKLVEGAVEYETNKSIKQILNKRLDENNYSHIMFDDSLTPKEGTAKQEAAKTQGKYQDRVVDSNYVKQSLDMLKEISIETAHELEQLLGDEWQDKVIKYLEDGWGAKPAHAIGILNIISTDIYNQLQSDELTQNEYDNLKEKQKRVDTLANAISRDISQGMNMRRLYQVFAQGGDVTTAIAESYLPEKTVEEINNLRESISRAKTDAELANAGRPKGTKSSTKTTNQNNTSVNKSSKKELLQRMKDKANNLVNKSGKKIDDIVNEIIDKIKKLKC